jgi:phage/plasmid-associated DNA primase
MTEAITEEGMPSQGFEPIMNERIIYPVRPDFIYEGKDTDGEPTGKLYINFVKFSNYLHRTFRIVNFKGMLFIYDRENHVYKENLNEIATATRDVYSMYGITGKLPAILNEIEAHIKSMGNESEYPFNNSVDTIPVINGIVKINYDNGTVELLVHGPEHRFTYKLNVYYDFETSKDIAVNLLSQWVDNPNVLLQIPAQAILQMQLGHPYKKAYLLQGDPNAGKSSYLDFLKDYFFTKEFVSAIRLQQICNDRFAGGQMEGKLINVYDDLEDVPLDTIDAFKTLTGSCSHGIERKHRDGYTGKISAVHVFSCNYPPEYPPKVKRDTAFWDRWEYVIFPNSFSKDLNFYARVFTEEMKSSFLNAMLWAMCEIKKNGLLVVSDIETVMNNWSINSDPIYDFLSKCFLPGDGKTPNYFDKAPILVLYNKYCVDNKIPIHKRKPSLKALTTALQSHEIFPRKRMVGKYRKEVYETTMWKLQDETLGKEQTIVS